MLNTVLSVKEVPNLLTSKFNSDMISWREENGALIFQSADNESDYAKRRAAFERLKKYRAVVPNDFDYKKELMEALDEKYGSIA